MQMRPPITAKCQARKLYFSPLYHVSDTAYVLDLRKPGISKIVRNF